MGIPPSLGPLSAHPGWGLALPPLMLSQGSQVLCPSAETSCIGPQESMGSNLCLLKAWWHPPARGPGTLIPSAQRLVWAAKQPLGNAALGALFA